MHDEEQTDPLADLITIEEDTLLPVDESSENVIAVDED